MSGSHDKALRKLCESGGSIDVRTLLSALKAKGCTVEQTGANEYKVKRAGYRTQIIALPHDGKDVGKKYLSRIKRNLDLCEDD